MKSLTSYLYFFYFLLLAFDLSPEATATIRYVSKTGSSTPPYTTWATASDSIQKCIDYATAGDTIYVGNGVYKEKIVIDNKFLTLIGSGWDSCIVDAMEFEQFSGFHAVRSNGNCIIKGFYIQVSTQHWGSGILLQFCDSTTIVEGNKIENCSYGTNIINSNLICKNNLIVDVTTGVRLEAFSEYYYPVIENNIIITVYNFSQGIRCSFGTSPTIRNNHVISQEGGAGYYLILNPKEIRNNISEKVRDYNSDGFYFSLGNGIIENNLALSKTAAGRGMRLFRGSNKVRNNSMINGGQGYEVDLPDAINLKYNNAWSTENPFVGFSPDTTNLIVDPMIVSEDSSDFHLQMFSPLIDAGDPTILDRDGSRSDIGVYGGPYGEKYTYRDLAPKPPANLTAVYENKAVNLKWNRNTEADFSNYRIYRDTVPHFIYDITKIVGVTSDTLLLDNLPVNLAAKNYYYLVTALDSTNHQSAPSEELLLEITGMNEVPPKVVEEYKLLNNYPNPFNASTKVPYRLKEPGYVKLCIYDIRGELVKVLVNEWQNRGYYEVEFKPNESERKRGETGIEYWTGYNDDIATGRYIYQIIVIGEGNIPLFSNMGKMILLK